jgi:hypothetical protein
MRACIIGYHNATKTASRRHDQAGLQQHSCCPPLLSVKQLTETAEATSVAMRGRISSWWDF